MKKALVIVSILMVAVISTACINNIAVQELNNKANEYMQKGDYESAMNRLQASLDLDSTMYQTYYNLGIAAINAKKYETAIDALRSGIKIKPEYNDFYYSLGVAQIALADEIMEEKDEVGEDGKKSEITQEDKDKAVELKRDAIDNLTVYLQSVPQTPDRETVEEMIKQSQEFISPGEGENSKE